MMNSQEETTVRLGLDLVVLILEDNAYGMIRWKQTTVFLTSGWPLAIRTSWNTPSRMEPEAGGCTPQGLLPTLAQAFSAVGVHVVAIPIDYSENMRVLVDELTNRVPTFEPAWSHENRIR
jgi:acetolactate synthase-1/2/3 large subunit